MEKKEHNLGEKDFAVDENSTAGYYQTQVLNHSKEKKKKKTSGHY